MHLLDRSVVDASEIDSLGHMNVRFYMARVERANARLMGDYGLDAEALRGQGLLLTKADSYCRYHREQFAGANLEVHGGVLDASEEAARLFYELRNPDKGQTAATFIIDFALKARATRQAQRLPEAVVRRAQAETIALPDYGAPRSLTLEPPRLDVSLQALERKLANAETAGLNGGRFERLVEAEDCDEHGFLREGEDLMFSTRMMNARRNSGETFGPPTFTTDDGRRFGWAFMETRVVLVDRPRAGDQLRTVGADVGLHRKTRHSRRWIFNLTRGVLAGIDDTLGIALDLDARRSIEIPSHVRARLEKSYVPEFA